ncbi:hypothetical protein BDV59DRAFT_185625 [Aspergillus ambiguus]|uniref:uncharacterized protein n=1 Tax=Aspergillus ambiguus TaxID=176160 RepID=UPI003CCE1D49
MMTSRTVQTQRGATNVCDLCSRVLWFRLPPEEDSGRPHHKSRKALEASAAICILCQMVLRAAISNYQDSRGVRMGRGYWKQLDHNCVTETGSSPITSSRELGIYPPKSETEVYPSLGLPVIFTVPYTLTLEFVQNGGMTAVAPTTQLGADMSTLEPGAGVIERLSSLDIERSTEDLPVWLYGNYWATAPTREGDQPHLRLMGIGARFGKSPTIFDAHNTSPGEVSFRGSAIGISTNDGEFFP